MRVLVSEFKAKNGRITMYSKYVICICKAMTSYLSVLEIFISGFLDFLSVFVVETL